jgi:iron(III) transport system permease protein
MAFTKSKELKVMGDARIDTGQILLGLSVVILVITIAMPLFLIVYNTFFYKFSFDPGLFTKIILNPENAESMLNTMKVAFAVTFFGTLVGLFFAWLIGRSDIPFKEIMKTLFVIPYMFPPFIGAMAWGLLFSERSGYLNKLFMQITGGTTPLFNIYSLAVLFL